MASPDVLASCLVDLEPGYSELWSVWMPGWEKIINRGNKETMQSYQKEFTVTTAGPGDVTSLPTGNEMINGGRNQTGQRGNTTVGRMIYAFDVPGKDIDEANGEGDIAKLIADYPDAAMADFQKRVERQLFVGDGVNVGAFTTWNGDATWNPDGTTRTGSFSFAAIALQTSTVFGLPKQGAASGAVTGWYNGYDDITSFAANGERKIRDLYYKTSRQAPKMQGPVDLMFADESTFNNYVEGLKEPVRFQWAEVRKGEPSNPDVKQGVPFLGAVMYCVDQLDPADASFTTAAVADGLLYGIHSPSWHLLLVGRGGLTQNKGFFSTRGPFRIPELDLWRYEIVLAASMYTKNLKANFVITGGGTP